MPHSFPSSAAVYERTARGAVDLDVIEGAVPSDLAGYVYVVAPTGRHREGPGRHDVIPFLNGDGTVYRIALAGGQPRVEWALAKPPCHWAEIGAEVDPDFRHMRFRDWGIARLSDDLSVGGRNLLNTAFQAVRFAGDASDRLILTYEAGRPFEVDPVTLEVVTPIGRASAWKPTMLGGTPFEVVAATSHPAFDPDTDMRGAMGRGVMFMVNYVRPGSIYVERVTRMITASLGFALFGAAKRSWRRTLRSLLPSALRGEADELSALRRRTRAQLFEALLAKSPLEPAMAQLLVWDGQSEPTKVTLLGADGKPLAIDESAHQMAVTSSYVLIVDAAFKFEVDLVLPYFKDHVDDVPAAFMRFVRERLSRIQPQKTRVHLVPRSELRPGATVRVKTVTLDPCSAVHYFADYDDAGGSRVVIHAIDNAAADSSEFVLESDRGMFPPQSKLPRHVLGMMPSAMDVDRMSRWEIEPSTGRVSRTAEQADEETMWTIALATGPGVFTSKPPTRHEHLFFYTHGFLPEAMSELVWKLYSDARSYKRRKVPLDRMRAMGESGGRGPVLCRYDATEHRIADKFVVPTGWFILSPQYVPLAGSPAPAGYIVATAFGPDERDKQVWVFRADDLAAGPVCKLKGRSSVLPWGYTLHTTWLADAVSCNPNGYRVAPDEHLPANPNSASARLVREHVLPKAYR